MTVKADIAFDTFHVLAEFNRGIRLAVLSLEALTRCEGFDPEQIEVLANLILKAKASTNCYLISILGSSEEGELGYQVKRRAHAIGANAMVAGIEDNL